MPSSGSGNGKNKLIGDRPSRRKDFFDRTFCLKGNFQGTLEMCLDNELFESDLRSFFLKGLQHLNQFIVHTHGKVGQQSGTQADPLHFCEFFSVGTVFIRFLLPQGHFIHSIKQSAQRFILAHERISPGDQDIP